MGNSPTIKKRLNYLPNEGKRSVIQHFKKGKIIFKQWSQNSKQHRLCKPSTIMWWDNGNIRFKEWRLNGKRHRKKGPSVIYYYPYPSGKIKSEIWYVNDIRLNCLEISNLKNNIYSEGEINSEEEEEEINSEGEINSEEEGEINSEEEGEINSEKIQ
jgi:hypothetical protein